MTRLEALRLTRQIRERFEWIFRNDYKDAILEKAIDQLEAGLTHPEPKQKLHSGSATATVLDVPWNINELWTRLRRLEKEVEKARPDLTKLVPTEVQHTIMARVYQRLDALEEQAAPFRLIQDSMQAMETLLDHLAKPEVKDAKP